MLAVGRIGESPGRNSSKKGLFFTFWRSDTHMRIVNRLISAVARNSCFRDRKGSRHNCRLAPIAARYQPLRWPTIPIAIGLLVSAINVALGTDEPFKPIRKLTTWYTDRNLIDIEIVGSTSLVPQFHRIESERVLRFRLERAYVQTLQTEAEPGFEIVGFGLDMETGLADSLIVAVSLHGSLSENIPGIPHLSDSERVQRTLFIKLRSDMSSATLERGSAGFAECRGVALGNELFAFEWEGRSRCLGPSYPKGSKYVAQYDNGLMLSIECHEPEFSGFGCSFRFPFKMFGAEVTFHRDHLSRWRDMATRASAFLESKRYP